MTNIKEKKPSTYSMLIPDQDSSFDGIWETFDLGSYEEGMSFHESIEPRIERKYYSHTSLPVLTKPSDEENNAELNIGEVIGKGSMGVIREGLQTSLRREVAIKSIKPSVDKEEATAKLMREAIVTGFLEHPNIVPVHLLGKSDSNDPLLVMKKIQGVSWQEVLKNPTHDIRKGDKRDFLVWNLHMLLRVCNAIQYAHSKQIIHRDLKPENIMFGPFGEVYVMDWGLAVSLDKEETELPVANQETGLVGTPSYMAPEMLQPKGEALCLQTDIYLLGAILFEILTGDPPHRGKNLYSVLFQVHQNGPHKFPSHVPKELASIVLKALATNPEERYQDANELKHALLAYLEHRSSIHLSDKGAEKLRELEDISQSTLEFDAEKSKQVGLVFEKAKVFFQQALEAWKQNPTAKQGLERALWLRSDYELKFGEYLTAWQFIHEMEGETSDLRQRLAVWKKDKEQEKKHIEELEKIRHENDVSIGARSRSYLALILAVFWSLMPLLVDIARKHLQFEISRRFQLAAAVILVLAVCVISLIWRKELLQSRINRRVVRAVVMASIANFFLNLISVYNDLTLHVTVTLDLFVFAVVVGMLATGVDAKLSFPACNYLLFSMLCLLFPDYSLVWLAIGNFVSLTSISIIWRIEDKEKVSKPFSPFYR